LKDQKLAKQLFGEPPSAEAQWLLDLQRRINAGENVKLPAETSALLKEAIGHKLENDSFYMEALRKQYMQLHEQEAHIAGKEGRRELGRVAARDTLPGGPPSDAAPGGIDAKQRALMDGRVEGEPRKMTGGLNNVPPEEVRIRTADGELKTVVF